MKPRRSSIPTFFTLWGPMPVDSQCELTVTLIFKFLGHVRTNQKDVPRPFNDGFVSTFGSSNRLEAFHRDGLVGGLDGGFSKTRLLLCCLDGGAEHLARSFAFVLSKVSW